MDDVRLVLASRSPRRAALLRAAGYAFAVEVSAFEDPDQPAAGGDASSLVEGLALEKALPVARAAGGAAWVIGADTVCVGLDGGLIGKPADAAGARAMLEALGGSEQVVKTGVALVRRRAGGGEPSGFTSWVSAATVRFAAPPAGVIDAYVAGGHWRGKAGGYNLTELEDAGWAIEVAGDPTAVVGLPMGALARELGRLGIEPGEGAGDG